MTLEQRCCQIADKVVPAYRADGTYCCHGYTAKRWEAAYHAAKIALTPETTREGWQMPWAVIDPNWNEGDVVVLETVAATREAAIDLAETDKGLGLWSGYSQLPLPGGTRGSIKTLEAYGYRVAEVEVLIKET